MMRTWVVATFLIMTLIPLLLLNSCSQKNPHLYEKYDGIYIDHSLRQGLGYADSTGRKYWFTYVKTVITNDSVIPARVKLYIPKGNYESPFGDHAKYNVFILPDSMTENNESKDYYLVSGRLKKFFDSGLANSFTFDTVLKPKEAFTVYIGFITEASNRVNPYLSLFSRGHKPHFWPSQSKSLGVVAPSDAFLSIPDSAINKYISPTEKQLSLFLGVRVIISPVLEKGNYYTIIPCGQVSYSN